MNRKQLKKMISGAVLGAMCFTATPAFALEAGGVLPTDLSDVKSIEPRGVQYRSLMRNSFEDGTWNLIPVAEVEKTNRINDFKSYSQYFEDMENSKFVEAGLADLPIDFGTWVLYDIKEIYRTGSDNSDVSYAVQYAPKVGNAVYDGNIVCTANVGGSGNNMFPAVKNGFRTEELENYGLEGKALIVSSPLTLACGFASVGEKLWTNVNTFSVTDDSFVYLFMTDKAGAVYPIQGDLGYARTGIVGAKLHLEDKSYRNFKINEVSEVPNNTVALTVNGETVSNDSVTPFIYNGTTMVPLRLAAESVGAKVDYKDAQNQLGNNIVLTKNSDKVDLFTKSTLMAKNEEDIVKMQNAPVIVNGSSYVPVRAVAEALGCKVSYDSDTRTVSIES